MSTEATTANATGPEGAAGAEGAVGAGPAEQLSALLDGELPPEQTEFLLKRAARDADLRATLARYQLVGDTLRGERVRARPDFVLRVSAAIAAEPALSAPAIVRGRAKAAPVARWLRPVAGLAIAAGVASVAVFVMQRDPALPPTASVAANTTPVAGVVAEGGVATGPTLARTGGATRLSGTPSLTGEPASYVTPPATPGAGVIPPAQLASYVVAHSEYSAPLGRRNVLTGLVAGEPLAAPAVAPVGAVAAPASAATAPVSELR